MPCASHPAGITPEAHPYHPAFHPLTTLRRVRESRQQCRTRQEWPSPAKTASGLWLRNAAAGLCVLAAAAAAVSFTAQYRMVDATRHLPAIAALEAAIPDAAALVFACLGVALALHGRHAIRARALNLASVGASVFMNAIAAAPGWRNLAIWAMPPVAYALASDTLIGVVRAWALARQQRTACRAGCRRGHSAGHHRRAGLVAAASQLWPPPPPCPGSVPGCWRNARSPPAAALPARPRPSPPLSRPGWRPHRSRWRSRARRRRLGSFLWSPNGTGHLPPSPLIASPGSAPPWPRRRT